MRFIIDLATSLLLFIALSREAIATPLETTSRDLDTRAALTAGTCCVNPSQLSLSQSLDLGSCNWKTWVLCTALAAGACFTPCAGGGYVLPFRLGRIQYLCLDRTNTV